MYVSEMICSWHDIMIKRSPNNETTIKYYKIREWGVRRTRVAFGFSGALMEL
jgi:hypothetical protein